MSTESSESSSLKRVRIIADFQFGRGTGVKLFPEDCTFRLSSTKRIRYVMSGKVRLATVRAGDGRLTLGKEAGERLCEILPAPAYRTVVRNDVAEFITAGKNAMAKHVISADTEIRAGDEVLVCNEQGSFLGVGNAVLSGEEMLSFNYGVAVQVRKGS
ncbi:MAG: pseudouridine synthase [Methanomicrobiaceae archaeon]|nr:pseudouridine synthase [Methanomicrobiaceae archaeon]